VAAAPFLIGQRTESRQNSAQTRGQPTAPPAPAEASSPAPDRALLPNLRSLPAAPAEIRTTGGRRQLRFAAAFSNVGAGPLVLLPDAATSCPAGQRHVVQAVYHDSDGDGRFLAARDRRRTTTPAGCMLFHPQHRHWHFDATARYALTTPGSDVAVATQDKVSFCVRDSGPLRRGSGARPTYGRCTRDRPQGLSVGWYDVYRATLPGQALDLPAGLPDGTYCLQTQADPLALLQESREDDNAAVQPVRIVGNTVTRGPPGGCPPV
jgi:hypothetical protein